MSKMKWLFPLSSVLLLAACGGESSAPAAASSASAAAASTPTHTAASAEIPAPAASAASTISASDTAASDTAPTLGGALSELNQAKWQSYTCDEGKIDVRYYKSSAGPAAQIKFKGAALTAPYSPELSDEDLSAFSNGSETWTIGNEFDGDFYKEANGFFVRHEHLGGTDEESIVDNLLVQNCKPSAP